LAAGGAVCVCSIVGDGEPKLGEVPCHKCTHVTVTVVVVCCCSFVLSVCD